MSDTLEIFDELIRQISHRGRTICLTSVREDCGPTALFLAERLILQGHSCLLVDFNTDEPRLGLINGIMNQSWSLDIDETLQAVQNLPNKLAMLAPSTPPPPKSTTSQWLKKFLQAAEEQYDFILLSAAPLLADHFSCPKPTLLAELTSVTALLTTARVDTQADLVKARDLLAPVGNRLAGVLINDNDNPNLADRIVDELQRPLAKHPLLLRRAQDWLHSIAILNIEY